MLAKAASCAPPSRPVARPQRGRHRGRQADERQRPAPAQIGETRRIVAEHIGTPGARSVNERAAHIGVVIAGHQAHVLRVAQSFQPDAPARELFRQRDIGKVAGASDVVSLLRLQVGDDLGQHAGVVDEAAPALPVDVAGQPLIEQLGPVRRRQRRQMRIGEMGEGRRPCREAYLRAPDQYPGDEHQHAADHDLECGLQERRVHVARADPGDRRRARPRPRRSTPRLPCRNAE